MPVKLTDLVAYLDKRLTPEQFRDYCPNGLQVEGKPDVSRIVSGVTASQALIDQAIALGADLLLVHHGFFWKGEDSCITGMKKRRIQALLEHGISLVAYHLPLDAHPEVGNNAQLAKLLDIEVTGGLETDNPRSIGNVGRLAQPLSLSQLVDVLETRLKRKPLAISGGEHLIETLAWCTGGAQGYIDKATAQGVDAYISGEISEPTYHHALENGIHYLAAGHHATERYGVQALGEELALQFNVQHQYVEIDNPV